MKKLWWVVFLLYLAVLFRLTIFRSETLEHHQWNFSLFVSFIKVYQNSTLWQFCRLLFGNIGWFVPLGWFLPYLTKKKAFTDALFGGALLSLFIELLQLIFKKGIFELDDLILNTMGALIGYLVFYIMHKKPWRKEETS